MMSAREIFFEEIAPGRWVRVILAGEFDSDVWHSLDGFMRRKATQPAEAPLRAPSKEEMDEMFKDFKEEDHPEYAEVRAGLETTAVQCQHDLCKPNPTVQFLGSALDPNSSDWIARCTVCDSRWNHPMAHAQSAAPTMPAENGCSQCLNTRTVEVDGVAQLCPECCCWDCGVAPGEDHYSACSATNR
jgi:hypothetical protein